MGETPEMHQTKKGHEWHFGMKAHSGAAKRDPFRDAKVVWHVAEKRGKLKKMEVGPRRLARPECA